MAKAKKTVKNLPSLQELKLVGKQIKWVPNRKGEFLRKVHYGCFLLCSEVGLRISEAVKFDLGNKTKGGLYRISKCKGKKERLVYVSREIVGELKKNNWQPNQTNRWNFYHFLKKVKREISSAERVYSAEQVSENTEFTPHTLRRAFTTYHAENGMPLPVLQKLLGHSSVRTTALYWQDIYSEDDVGDILTGKKWLERSPLVFDKDQGKLGSLPKEPPEMPLPNTERFPRPPENPDSDILINKPLITAEKSDNNLSLIAEKTPMKPKTEKISPTLPKKSSPLINRKSSTTSEQSLLIRINQLEENLVSTKQQLAKVQAENEKLRTENKALKTLFQQDQATEIYSVEQAKVIQSLPFKVKN